MDSSVFYNTIRDGFAEVSERIKEAGAPRASMFIHVSNILRKGEPSITLSNGDYSGNKIEVTGRDINDLVHEYIRRAGFDEQQARVALAPPVVDLNANGQEAQEAEDIE